MRGRENVSYSESKIYLKDVVCANELKWSLLNGHMGGPQAMKIQFSYCFVTNTIRFQVYQLRRQNPSIPLELPKRKR